MIVDWRSRRGAPVDICHVGGRTPLRRVSSTDVEAPQGTFILEVYNVPCCLVLLGSGRAWVQARAEDNFSNSISVYLSVGTLYFKEWLTLESYKTFFQHFCSYTKQCSNDLQSIQIEFGHLPSD
jgi:hypothetical protein